MSTKQNGFHPATDFAGRHDASLLALESRWLQIRKRIRDDLPDETISYLCEALAELEARLAVAQAHTAFGVAAKLRVIHHYCTEEGHERPHWLSLLASALSDLEMS